MFFPFYSCKRSGISDALPTVNTSVYFVMITVCAALSQSTIQPALSEIALTGTSVRSEMITDGWSNNTLSPFIIIRQ